MIRSMIVCGILAVSLLACDRGATAPSAPGATASAVAPAPVPDACRRRVDADLAAFDMEVDRRQKAFVAPADPHEAEEAELAHRVEIDQYWRGYMDLPHLHGYSECETKYFVAPFMERAQRIDEANTAWLEKQVAAHGWFRISEYGAEADDDAWLLVQHADRDVAFQKEILAILEKLIPAGETSKKHYAYLYDRVAIAEKRPQRFGTQGECTRPGVFEPLAVEEPARLDELRASFDLSPIDEYKEMTGYSCL
jgi:hypothetical protein